MPEPLEPPQSPETVFTYAAPSLVYGPGAIRDIAFHLPDARRVLIVTDPLVVATGAVQRVIDTLPCQVAVWDDTHIEPTDESLRRISDYVRRTGRWDAFIAVGGGSSIDTAKAANLMFTNPGDLLDYVNAPIGGGRAPTQPLKPLIAVPTTTGTGSESTTICVLDVLDRHVKTGISHARLRPTLAVVDPDLTMSQPPMVTACAGLDILCHALESYTARPYTRFDAKSADERVPYCGANPISDMWAEQALRLMAEAFLAAVRDDDPQARAKVALAATLAGMGFGNAGVHVPACQRLPDRRTGARLPPTGLPAGRAFDPARDGCGAHRTRGVPCDLRGLAAAPRSGGAPARRRGPAGDLARNHGRGGHAAGARCGRLQRGGHPRTRGGDPRPATAAGAGTAGLERWRSGRDLRGVDVKPTREDFPIVYTMSTRWNDNDHYGHMNNATYFEYIDTAVNGWLMQATGIDIRDLPAIGIVASTGCDYFAELGFPDTIEIGLATTRIGTSSISYRLGIFRFSDPQLRALAHFVHVYVDADTRRPVPIPEAIRAAVEGLPHLNASL
jgi:hydroxyacid-oxoacid transhydrogenase